MMNLLPCAFVTKYHLSNLNLNLAALASVAPLTLICLFHYFERSQILFLEWQPACLVPQILFGDRREINSKAA